MRYLTNKKRRTRRDANNDAARKVYAQAATSFPAEYLACHQEASPETKARIKAEAEARRRGRGKR